MTAFRRCFLALAVLVVVVGSIAPASAQTAPFNCTTTAAPPRIRYEGVTELVGDILITCTGTPTALNSGFVNIRVYLPGYPVTSRLEAAPDPVTGGAPTDALILVQPPYPLSSYDLQTNGAPVGLPGCAGSGSAPAGTPGCEWQGTWYTSDPDAITFNGIPVLPPGTNGAITYRITDVRINATQGNNPTGGSTTVPAYVAANPSTALPVTTSAVTAGFISIGLQTALVNSAVGSFLQCGTYSNTPYTTVQFQEGFADAFKQLWTLGDATPGNEFGGATESGFTSDGAGGPGTAAPQFGWADNPTQLEAYLTGLPVGVTVVVAGQNVCAAGSSYCIPGTSVATLTANGDGSNCTVGGAVGPSPVTYNCVVSSTGTLDLIWAVQSEVPTMIEVYDFPLWITFTGNPNQGFPAITPGTAQATLNFFPLIAGPSGSELCVTGDAVCAAGYASAAAAPIPRFVQQNPNQPVSAPSLSVTQCVTYLLYPYVTDVTGFNTGIAISNTSLDPFGTIPAGLSPTGDAYNPSGAQAGTCAVNFYGGQYAGGTFTETSTNIGAALSDGSGGQVTSVAAGFPNTGIIAPGETWAFDVETYDSNPGGGGFTGYAIATCNFNYAHGYAFVSDLNIEHFATSYLALIIPGGNSATAEVRTITPFPCTTGTGMNVGGPSGCPPVGEQLGY